MGNQFRVLVVDDERDTRRLLCEGIASLGRQYDVTGVPSGEEAQLELARTLPHLLITDVRLAGISGLELLRKVRARDTALKVIVITGLDDQDIRRQAIESGADAFFTQPVEMVSFLEAVRGFLNGAAPVDAITPLSPAADVTESLRPEAKLIEKLDEFSQMFDSRAAVILDDRGIVRVSIGLGSETDFEMDFVQAVLQASCAGAALISTPSWGLTANLQVYYGENRIYLLSPLVMGFTLLTALPSAGSGALQAGRLIEARAVIKEIDNLIRSLQGFDESQREALLQDPDASPLGEETEPEPDVEPDHNMEAIFSSSAQIDFSRDDVDEFWDDLAASAEKDYYANGNVISYEEARRMGLAPGNDEA